MTIPLQLLREIRCRERFKALNGTSEDSRSGTFAKLTRKQAGRNSRVSACLGLPSTILFGGSERGHKQKRIALLHGDVVVWGGVSRLNYHGIAPLKAGVHPLTGACRFNLTFRLAG
ncbi:MAG TPA: alpha-ketoglutarate-dependent dioxygenase AlkB [Candidatus Obscuribacter sp.]|nr:alpha-ketoglutarate-dependent dioxygenase AlkB [Candidatus Obscuribacter sp.]